MAMARRLVSTPVRLPSREEFWANVSPEPMSGCWLWTRASGEDYGRFYVGGGVFVKAHRLSYELFRGPIPPNLVVCHHCDNKARVNPSHLFVGTIRDNALDMMAKGRGRYVNPCVGKTHCKHGHEFTPENTFLRGHHRACRECRRAALRDLYRRKKALPPVLQRCPTCGRDWHQFRRGVCHSCYERVMRPLRRGGSHANQ
jgi:HNH endonuclease